MAASVIDSDGHIVEDQREMVKYMQEPFNVGHFRDRALGGLFPSLDGFHFAAFLTTRKKQRERAPGEGMSAESWLEFADAAGIRTAVLYPTSGLGFGLVQERTYAAVLARAYNDYFHECFYKPSNSRLRGAALVPIQDPAEAVREIRRAVNELNMVAAFIPSNGLRRHLSHRDLWPIYEEAERLDVPVALHGGSMLYIGIESFHTYPAAHVLHHPIPLMINLSGFIFDGVMDRFPRLRVGFLEGGTGWLPFMMDRMDREHYYFGYKEQHGGLPRKPSDYVRSGRIFVGCEGSEGGLPYAVKRAGKQAFLFASDFPHEIGLNEAREEVEEIENNEALVPEEREAILRENGKAFYRLQ